MTAHQKILQKPDMEGLAARDKRLTTVRFDGVMELSELMQSYLRSISEAAWRQEPPSVRLHLVQLDRALAETIRTFRGVDMDSLTVTEQFFDNVMMVLRDHKVREWFKAHEGKDATGKTTCPVCDGWLRVRSSKTGRSGGGKCETEGCAEWMS